MTTLTLTNPARNGVFSRVFIKLARLPGEWEARRRLHALDDFMLRDMGITRSEIRAAVRGELRKSGLHHQAP